MANDKKFVVKNGLTTQNISFVDNITSPGTTQTITLTDIGNWDTAFGWGNHASAGYLTDAPSDGNQYARQDGSWAVVTGGGGGIVDIVQDTTPQLGGDLDLNSNDITGTGNVAITGEVNATQVQLSGGTGDQGTLSWNTDEETLDLIDGAVTLQVGQEVVYHVRNNSGASIADGTPVMATGTIGNSSRITIAPMDATNVANAKYYLGVTTETIANDADGKVTHFGKVRGINLSAYQEGDVLWLSTTTVGAFTTTEPTIGIKIPTAFVISNNSNGTMFVRSTNSVGLVDLDDVQISSPASGELLYYDGSKFTNNSTTNLGILTEDALNNTTNVEDTFTANGSATTFTLSEAPLSAENILVSVDGVIQPSSAYSVASLTLTITPALPNGTSIRVLHLKTLAIGTGTLVKSDPTGVTGADVVTNVISLTQAEYDAITPDSSTFYIITG